VLAERGAQIAYHDPHVPELARQDLRSSPLDDLLDGDVIVLVTAHPGIDYGAVVRDGPLFVDLRGVTRGQVKQGVVTL
jgi:UDP-N-acetyl-D-glucosamine dehydrogenase